MPPGGYRPRDTFRDGHNIPIEVREGITKLTQEEDAAPDEPILPEVQVPRTVRDFAARQGPEWCARLSWADAKGLHGQTLVDIPKGLRALYADLKVSVIGEIEEAGPAMERGGAHPRERAWMKLNFMDAMVLNSTRSPGESQAQSVARWMRNFQGEQWESVWLEATRPQIGRAHV